MSKAPLAVSDAKTQLRVEQARAILAECRRVDEVAKIKDASAAMATYLRAQKAAADSILDAEEINVRAQRRIGELTRAMDKVSKTKAGALGGEAKAGLASPQCGLASTKRDQLEGAGVSKQRASEYEKLAAMPERQFEERLGQAREAGRVTTRAVLAKAHVSRNTGECEWYTPPAIIEAARTVMGGIDLDPASSDVANETVRAEAYYTAEDDGLQCKWHGRVWMNPPYSQPLIAQFCDAVADEYEARRIKEAIVLVNNGTESKWGQRILGTATAVCFPASRIRFLDENGKAGAAPLQGQMICYIGKKRERFCKVFGELGVCLSAAG